MGTMTETIVQQNPEHSRFEILVDGAVAGFAEYRTRPNGQTVFTHTEVDADFAGRGLGGILARGAVEAVLADPAAVIVPACPFIRSWLHKHPEHADRVDESSLPPEHGGAGL